VSVRNSILILALFAGAMAFHLVPGLDSSQIEINIRNALHVVGFAAVTALVFRLIDANPLAKYFGAFSGALLLGIFSEVIQSYRRWNGGAEIAQSLIADSAQDILRDLFGAGMILLALFMRDCSKRFSGNPITSIALKFGSAAAIITVCTPIVFWVGVSLLERSKSPVLIDIDGRWASLALTPINSAVDIVPGAITDTGGGGDIRITLSRRPRSGVAISPTFNDWSSYSSLLFSARLDIPSSTVVTVHINDRERLGRFRDLAESTVEIGIVIKTFCVSLDKVVAAQPGNNMSNIGQLVFLARSRRDGAILSIGDVRLSQARCGTD
jgi:VanZ family protein